MLLAMYPSRPTIHHHGEESGVSADIFLGMDLRTLVGHCATLCTITLFLTGIEICRKIKSRGSTLEISALPFICGLASCSLWLRYGVLVHDTVLITVNLVGSILQVFYLICYSLYSVHKSLFMKQLTGVLVALGFLFLYTSVWISDVNISQKISGLAACTATVIFLASPLASLRNVLKTKSVDSLPFPMIVFSFIMSSLWVWYGILINDAFVQVPNFLGALVSGCQLCLFAMYPSKKIHLESSIA